MKALSRKMPLKAPIFPGKKPKIAGAELASEREMERR